MLLERKNIVGDAIKISRESKNPKITQEGLSTRLQLLGWSDCDRFTVSKIELGTRKVTDYELKLLSKALGVSSDTLLGELE
ncbi:helix-turn-helix domain-containing protein [Desulfatibacillum aliphaticivorans]|uniref:helix-turn-helix domain-containing protein n=1 Tax=Desulfatibacillum aliphaticivorans TaxID=218208 RepID=UPI0009FF8D82|nr:helix-turn-helix transcriptional regulator [Desulfatibacillum aliphaticivorans]